MKRLMSFTLAAALALLAMLEPAPAFAAVRTAKAGSAVVKGRIVKLTAAGVVAHATAVTDSAVGICTWTQATTNANTRYAGVGEVATVTSGEAITIGDLLTGGTLGKAFVLDTDDASTQRWVGIALTAATDADQDVTVCVSPGAAEQRLAPAIASIAGGYGDTGVTISDAGVAQFNGAVTTDGAMTAATAVINHATTPSISLVTGKTNTGTITVNGKTSGSFVVTTADATAQAVTLAPAAQTSGAGSVTIPDLAGNARYIPPVADAAGRLDFDETAVAATASGVTVGLPFVIVFEPSAAATLSYTVPTGRKLRVLDAYGFKTVAAGAHADDDWNLQNNDGTAANIFDAEELNTIADKARILFDNLDDSERDVAAGSTLDLVANENAGGGCDGTIYVLCIWVTP